MAEERSSRLASSNVKVKKSYLLWQILKRVARAAGTIVIILALVYALVLVPTAVRFIYTDEFGLVLTKDPTIREGAIPAGKTQLVSIGSGVAATESIKNKMIAGFTSHENTSVVKIVAGPAGRLSFNKNDLAVYNGKEIKSTRLPISSDYELLKDNHFLLDNQYYVQCVGGVCSRGDFYIMSRDDILGEIKTDDTDQPLKELIDRAKSDNGDSDSTDDTEGSADNNDNNDDSVGDE